MYNLLFQQEFARNLRSLHAAPEFYIPPLRPLNNVDNEHLMMDHVCKISPLVQILRGNSDEAAFWKNGSSENSQSHKIHGCQRNCGLENRVLQPPALSSSCAAAVKSADQHRRNRKTSDSRFAFPWVGLSTRRGGNKRRECCGWFPERPRSPFRRRFCAF